MILDKISYISSKVEQSLRFGHPCCNEEALILLLVNTAKVECLSKSELTKYNDIVKGLTFDCNTFTNKVQINTNNKEQWEEANPECISRKTWERIALKICYKYKLDFIVENIDKACEIAFDITKDILHCDVITSISVQQKMCALDIKVDKTPSKCISEYKILIEKYNNCNLTKKEYIQLLDNNFSFEIISSIYNNNLYLEIDSRGQVLLVSPTVKYNLKNDLKFKEIVVNSDTKELVFTKRILNDYNINNKLKKQILNDIFFI